MEARRLRGLLNSVLLLALLLAGCGPQARTTTSTPVPASLGTSAGHTAPQAATAAAHPSGVTVQPTEMPLLSAAPARSSSIEKIEAALSEGRIDEDTALVHLLAAMYDPASLPAQFKSDLTLTDAAPTEGTTLLAALSGRLDRLPAALRAKVQAFLRRPTDPQSFWYAQLGDLEAGTRLVTRTPTPGPENNSVFEYVDTAGATVRVWYVVSGGAEASTQAEELAAEFDASGMWQRERQVMLGHEPCSDSSLDDNGGDSSLDVYIMPRHVLSPRSDDRGELVPFESAGLAIPLWTGGQCPVATFLLVNSSLSFDNLRITLAHELFHAFQFSFRTPIHERTYEQDYSWWMEASATWAEDFIYPGLNTEWIWLKPGGWADKNGPSGPLDAFARGGYEQYAAYIWPFYLTHRPGGDPQLIGRIMQAGEEEPIIEALSKMPDWEAGFKEFALWNWNKPSAQMYDDGGKRIRPLQQRAVPLSISLPPGEASTQVRADVDLPRVSIRYYSLVVSSEVQQLRLDLRDITGQGGAGVQAVVTMGDPQSPDRLYNDDWSTLPEKTFCRIAAGGVSNIVLVVSNSLLDEETNLTGRITVTASGRPCSGESAP